MTAAHRSGPEERILAIDVSNSYTKLAVAQGVRLGPVTRIPTNELTAKRLAAVTAGLRFTRAVFGSVVPTRNAAIRRALRTPLLELNPDACANLIRIDFPRPEKIGADRLANAVAAIAMHGRPAIVVDFGTAVTFDVISADGAYIGGVIAPGLAALTDYLHERTALLPRVKLAPPRRAVGKSTTEAMLSGAFHGYRGLVAEILSAIQREAFPRRRPRILATGGDAKSLSRMLPGFAIVDPLLTLHGLRIAAQNCACESS